tara:strand:+ start:12161 stop:15766 length:3606 start_codon:yes stop_codon:yes gene_type:complete
MDMEIDRLGQLDLDNNQTSMTEKIIKAGTIIVCRDYFSIYGFWRQQLESYERFMETTLPSILNNSEELQIVCGKNRLIIKFTNTTILPMYHREHDGNVRNVGPEECRQRKLTYQNGICVDVKQECYVQNEDDSWKLVASYNFLEVPLFKVPCMVRSKFCKLGSHSINKTHSTDFLGGYFIVNGMEKTVQAQIKLRANSIHVFKNGPNCFYSEVRSSNDSQWKATSSLRVNISPLNKEKNNAIPMNLVTSTDDSYVYELNSKLPTINTSLPFFSINIPVSTICRLFGCNLTVSVMKRAARGVIDKSIQDSEIDLVFKTVIKDPYADLDREALILKLGEEGTKEKTPEKRRNYIKKMMAYDILPHLGCGDTEEINQKKIIYILLMACKAINAYLLSIKNKDYRFEDDRDNWRFKKVDCTGALIGVLVRQLMRTFLSALKSSLFKALDIGTPIKTIRIIDGFINSRKLETNIRYHFATGAWTVMRGVSPSACTGVCAPLTRITPVAAISALNRINCPVNRDGKTSTPRLLHTSDWGNSCCVETPEGGGCGLVLNFCALTHVRQGYESCFIIRALSILLHDYVNYDYINSWMRGNVLIFVNGQISFAIDKKDDFCVVKLLKHARHNGFLPFDVSIVHYPQMGIFVNADQGVCLRPVVCANKLAAYIEFLRQLIQMKKTTNTWKLLMAKECIEYVDTEEQIEHCIIATTMAQFFKDPNKYTHVEVDVNLAVMGVTANLIPFADFNQSPRIIYQSAMGKQSIGSETCGFDNRLDSNMYKLHYPQKPLCRTNMESILNLEPMLNGGSAYSASTEAILMIGTFDGFNQEDSILVNKASVQRGFARVTSYKTYFDEINGKGNDEEVFCKVSSAALMKKANYDHLDEDGFGMIGSSLKIGDVVIGKEGQSMELGPDGKHVPIKRDRSTCVKEPGIVDKVSYSLGKEGKSQVRIRMRQMRPGVEGDKFASRHAQKGTIGRLVNEEDLPFNPVTGMKPDIIINPHGFVSRMTIGMLVEALAGKACALKGCFCNATAFQNLDVSEIEDVLEDHGFDRRGYETFIDGRTGQKIQRPILMGIVTYQRLRHLVEDKINSRARGSKHIITEQPMDGRAKGGGLRVGEMERDCIISHGASAILHERMFLSSDKKQVPVCKMCGLIAEPAHNRKFAYGIKGAEPYCRNCNINNCHVKYMPGAQKLLQQELQAAQCGIRNF